MEKEVDITPSSIKKGRFHVDEGITSAISIASIYKKEKGHYVIVTSSLFQAQKLYEQLSHLVDEEEVLFFPQDELIRLDAIAMSKDMEAERLYTLSKIKSLTSYLIVTNVAALKRYLPKPSLFYEQLLTFSVGKKYALDDIRRKLTKAGYTRVNKVQQSLEYASRGDILDIFPIDAKEPVRLDFFDDELNDIRSFEISTQTSHLHFKKVDILPASSFLLTEEEEINIEKKMRQQLAKDLEITPHELKETLEEKVNEHIEQLISPIKPLNLYRYFSFLQNEHFHLLDWIEDAHIILLNPEQIKINDEMLENEMRNYLDELFMDANTLSHLSYYFSLDRILTHQRNTLSFLPFLEREGELSSPIKHIDTLTYGMKDYVELINFYLKDHYRILLLLNDEAQLNLVRKDLETNKISYSLLDKEIKDGVNILLCELDEGFIVPSKTLIILTPEELFHIKNHSRRFSSKFKEGKILQSFEELHRGDYVVHELYGIGQFLDIVTLDTDKGKKDFMHIKYRGEDVLYVPLEKFRLVRKYVGKEGYVPKLNSLNTKDWERTKERIKKRISDIAEKLMALYEARAKIRGISFKNDEELMNEFAVKFPFTLTKDQENSLKEIFEDMNEETPMDRLLCGDVGFGKTEVAFRAAFLAILNHKQVVFMCPTTLLAKQHFEVAKERFRDFGVRICMISRLTSKKEMEENKKLIESGEMHLIIATHRILSSQFKFDDLSLLIVDEEQRFGVEQKEKIKAMKANVDVLTLSATPIPRTLQMSLVKLRSLSQINSAPQERSPIQTYVIPYDIKAIKEIIERELARSGQVYYIHNDIATIYGVGDRLSKILPNKKIAIIHAKMNKEDVEDVMGDFYNGQIDVLIATSIVENGIDIANANTIIIEDADHFGLASLYQLKGRVGRGSRIAYAYLLYKPHKMMTESASKRLKAIQEFTELGSGYKIAERDLLIRGAGDILGAEQAGFIDSVGIDLFVKLLDEVVNEKRNDILTKQQEEDDVEVSGAFIPESYALKPDKLEIYHLIDDSANLEQLKETESKINDIYGRIPDEVILLLKKREIAILGKHKAINKVKDLVRYVDVYLSKRFHEIEGVGYIIFKKISEFDNMRIVKPTFVNREIMLRVDKKDESWVDVLIACLHVINEIYDEHFGGN